MWRFGRNAVLISIIKLVGPSNHYEFFGHFVTVLSGKLKDLSYEFEICTVLRYHYTSANV